MQINAMQQRSGDPCQTLSLWECDRVYPSWSEQPKIAVYLGYDPFTDPALGRPTGNESSNVAFSASDALTGIGHQIKNHRVQMRKTRKECAKELGVSVKTL